VVPGDAAFHDPADDAKAGAVRLAAAGDVRSDSLCMDGFAVLSRGRRRGRTYVADAATASGGPPARTGNCSTPPRCAPRATATGAQSSRPRGQPRDEHHPDTARELWSARCLERGTPGAGSGLKKRLDRKKRPRFGPTSPAAFCRRRRCQDVSVGTVDSVAVADRATAYHPALTGMSHQARSRLTANLTDAWTDQRDARRHHRRGAAQPALTVNLRPPETPLTR